MEQETTGRAARLPADGALVVTLAAGSARLRLSGEVDLTAAASFRSHLHTVLVDGHTDVVVDLSEVTFLDSSALGALVHGQRQTRIFRGSFRLESPSAPVARLLALTALDRVFGIRHDGDVA